MQTAMIGSIRKLSTYYWRSLLIGLVILGFLIWLLIFRLHSLVPGMSASEVTSITQARTFHQILSNPLNAPFKVLEYLIIHFTSHSIFLYRLVSAFLGLISIVFFYLILRHHYGKYAAIFSTLLLASSSWILHISRLATPEVLLFSLTIIIWGGLYMYHTRHDYTASFLMVILGAGLLYIPGMIWFVLIAIILERDFLIRFIDDLPTWLRICLSLTGLALIAPLAYGAGHTPSILYNLIGLPSHGFNLQQFVKHIAAAPLYIFWHGPLDPVRWLARLPILDAFTSIMFLLGLYDYWTKRKLKFNRLVVGALILGVILSALEGPVTISIIIPLLYLIVAAGITELLQQWLSVFPRNPLARGLGIGLLTIAIVLAGYYQSYRYFIAWPHSPLTQTVFQKSID